MAKSLAEFFTLKQNENNVILNITLQKTSMAFEALIDTGYFDGDETRFRITAIRREEGGTTNRFAVTIWKSKGTANTLFFALTKGKTDKIEMIDVVGKDLTYFEMYQIMTIWNLAVELGMKF